MQMFGFLIAAAAFLATGGAMAFYEWTRVTAGRPILNGSQAVTLYWIAYLSAFTLGLTSALAAIVR
jgi:hypothetical protein